MSSSSTIFQVIYWATFPPSYYVKNTQFGAWLEEQIWWRKSSVFLQRIFSLIHILLNIKLHVHLSLLKRLSIFFAPFVAQAPSAMPKPNNRSTLQPLHLTLIYSACPHESWYVKFTVKKISGTILGPIGAPHIAGSAGSVVMPQPNLNPNVVL